MIEGELLAPEVNLSLEPTTIYLDWDSGRITSLWYSEPQLLDFMLGAASLFQLPETYNEHGTLK